MFELFIWRSRREAGICALKPHFYSLRLRTHENELWICDRQLMNLELACSLPRSPQTKLLASAPGGFQPFTSTATTKNLLMITVSSEPLWRWCLKGSLIMLPLRSLASPVHTARKEAGSQGHQATHFSTPVFLSNVGCFPETGYYSSKNQCKVRTWN